MVAGWKDVRQHGEVEDLLQCLLTIRKAQEVPVGVRHHHVLGLAADPATHVDVSVGRAGSVGIGVETHAGVPFFAHPASSAGDVERDRAEVTEPDELHVATDFDHLARDLVPEYEA